jgi:hypothetical protein
MRNNNTKASRSASAATPATDLTLNTPDDQQQFIICLEQGRARIFAVSAMVEISLPMAGGIYDSAPLIQGLFPEWWKSTSAPAIKNLVFTLAGSNPAPSEPAWHFLKLPAVTQAREIIRIIKRPDKRAG